MKYRNQTPKNPSKLTYRELLNQTTALVTAAYPDLSHNDAQYVADLMVRYDEDVVEINAQYFPASEAHSNP